ncbi:hypothetical protein EC991_001767 [Linnemannia zychae]|nr:hypothetical protein EC991_001767 [Linnemannia zychae]
MAQPTKLAQRMKKNGGSSPSLSTTNGDSRKRKNPSSSLWGTDDFAGYGVNGTGDYDDEQDENKNTGNTENSTPTRKRKPGSGGAKIGGAEVKKQPREDALSKKSKSTTKATPSLPVDNFFVNYFNKIHVNEHRKSKEAASPSSPLALQPLARSASEAQSSKSLKEMFDRIPPSMIKPKETPTENALQEGAKNTTSAKIGLTEEAPTSSGKAKPIESGKVSQETSEDTTKAIKTNITKLTESRIDESVIEMMDVDDDLAVEPTPAKPKNAFKKSRTKATTSEIALTSEEPEEVPKITTKGSDTKKRKLAVVDGVSTEVKVDGVEVTPKEDPPKEAPPKNRSMFEFFKPKSQTTGKVLDSAHDQQAAGAKVGREFESTATKKQDVDQDQGFSDATSKTLSLEPKVLSTSILINEAVVKSTTSSPEETTKEVAMEEPAPEVDDESSPREQVKSPQPRRRRLVRASQLQSKSYQEPSTSESEQEEPIQLQKHHGSKNHKQNRGADGDTGPFPESEPEPEPEPEQEPAHVVASRQKFKSYFGSTSSLPPKSKIASESTVEATEDTKFFDLGVTRSALKTYSKRSTHIKKKTLKKRSAFSGSDEPGSDRDSRSDDDLSDFDIKVDEKPDPNQKSISSMFSKAPPRTSSFHPTFKQEQRKELTPLSQSLLSGGLVNVGNTCYLNSVLQALRNTPGCTEALHSMMQRIMELGEQSGRNLDTGIYLWRLFAQVVQVFLELDEREGRSAADQIYERSFCPKQVVEILRYVILRPEEGFEYEQEIERKAEKGGRDKDRITDCMFECDTCINPELKFKTERVQVCAKCDKVTTKQDRDFDLTVQIDTSNPGLVRDLEWGVSDTMKQEVTTEDNKRFCERCKSNEHAQMSNFFISLPKIMILRLQRSNFMQGAVKIPNGVACSQRMNFRQWMSSGYGSDHPDYELCAIIVHRGRDIFAGHYFAYIRKDVEIETTITEPDGESSTEKKTFRWLKYNDSSVDPVSDEDMEKLFSGNIKKQPSSSSGGGSGSGSPGENNKAHMTGEDKVDYSALSILDDHVATPYVYLYRRLDT